MPILFLYSICICICMHLYLFLDNAFAKYPLCVCKTGFSGSNCETKVDVCMDNPCFSAVNCTSTKVVDSFVAVCENCPAGYNGDGRKCNGTFENVFKMIDSFVSAIVMFWDYLFI